VGEPDFLYPFIEGEEGDAEALLADLARSAAAKAEASHSLRDATLARLHEAIGDAAAGMAARFRGGGRLFTFGNGGSATDAGSAAGRAVAGAGAPVTACAGSPGVALMPFPVITERQRAEPWWASRTTARLMLTEYMKLIFARLRMGLNPAAGAMS